MAFWNDFNQAFNEEVGRGPDDQAKMFYLMREIEGNKDDDAPRPQKMAAEHPLIYRVRELLGKADPAAVEARAQLGMGLKESPGGKAGQLSGAVTADLIQDRTRNWWWLLNAAQASANVINELGINAVNKDLYGARDIGEWDLDTLEKQGYAHKEGKRLVPNERVFQSGNRAKQRNYRSGMVHALGAPAGLAVNSGLGLMTPFGGYEGYEAVVPDPNDPSKTSNAIAEVATKYFLGRTGNLLPYDEFKKVRPDVSKAEYNAYKAFKYDKAVDLNPFDDGKFNFYGNVLRGTTDGIHGPEIQFLGRSLPVNTAFVPLASAIAGTMAGVRPSSRYRRGGDRFGQPDPNVVRRGLIGGTAGVAVGTAVGNLLESERRRRNQAQNESYGEL